jgi:hypothetical protein
MERMREPMSHIIAKKQRVSMNGELTQEHIEQLLESNGLKYEDAIVCGPEDFIKKEQMKYENECNENPPPQCCRKMFEALFRV